MLRLILLSILFLFSLLAILRAPTYHLWLLAILVTEFPMIPIVITSVILFLGCRGSSSQLPGSILGLIALTLFLSPIVRAYLVATHLNQNFDRTFKTTAGRSEPAFSIVGMITRKNNYQVNPRTVTYVNYGNTNLTLNLYPSVIPGKRPCIIVVHGGSWKSGDNKQLPELNSLLATEGYHVAALNYRLAPEYKSPLQVEDVKAAIKYLVSNCSELNIDTTRLVLLGRSAGAQIALMAAYTIKDSGLKGVIDFYGPADMVWGYSIPANPWVMNSRKVMEDYLGGRYETAEQNYQKSSPINFVSRNAVPTLIIHGKNDVLVAYQHSVRLKNMLEKYKVKHYFLSLPWATHGFDYTLNGPGGQLSTFAVLGFISEITQ